jgi:hypothetical protein
MQYAGDAVCLAVRARRRWEPQRCTLALVAITRKSVEDLDRAVRLSMLPGMTQAKACRMTGLSLLALRRARKEQAIRLTRDDLLLAALTANGERMEGAIGDLAALASWLDHVNHDGSTAAEVEGDLARLASEGRIVLDAGQFRLVGRWP